MYSFLDILNKNRKPDTFEKTKEETEAIKAYIEKMRKKFYAKNPELKNKKEL